MKKPENGAPPLDSREFLSFARGKLGDSWLRVKFKIPQNDNDLSLRTLDLWSCNPKHVGETSVRQNPIEKLEDMMCVLMERGHRHPIYTGSEVSREKV